METELYHFCEVDPVEHQESLMDIFNRCFNQNVSEDQFCWKYLNIKPEKMRTWAAIENSSGKPVAYYSAFRMAFRNRGEEILAYQGCDGMVLKEHRRYKLFQSLATLITKTLSDEGVEFYFGYCNDKSLPAVLKAYPAAVEMEHAYVYYFPIGTKNIMRRLPLRKGWADILEILISPVLRTLRKTVSAIKKTDIKLTPVEDINFVDSIDMSSLEKMHIVFPPRLDEYLSWKIIDAPVDIRNKLIKLSASIGEKIVGYCFATMDERRNVLVIRSVLCAEVARFQEMLLAVIRFALKLGVDGVLTNCSSSLYQQEYKKFGFIRGAKVLGFMFDLQNRFQDDFLQDDFILLEPLDRDLYSY